MIDQVNQQICCIAEKCIDYMCPEQKSGQQALVSLADNVR